MSYIYNLTDTWDNVGTTFTAIKMNATDTASAAGSLLMDLQIGGISKFAFRKDGRITTTEISVTNIYSGSLVQITSGAGRFDLGGDLFITRRAAANARLGVADAAAPVAQTLSVQSVVAGTSNTAGANFTITGSQGTGTGVGGSLLFQVAPAGSAGTAQNALATALTIDTTRTVTVSTTIYASTFANSGGQGITATTSQLGLFNTGLFGWTNNAGSAGALDTILARDAAGVLGVRGSSTTTPAAMSFYTYAASPPAAPAASIVRLYADTSGGKIRLMAIFPSGAAQQIAIEP